ncbi:L-PSP endoribonuclease family [Fusarium napiforme]|uniref:L-PSP endoribonuclease family n=1 Tax=Fusarium napiforme TaxID=42672 RepID=A0A8H5IHY8_9HYPO|nr:L-PSP endoribonuclease family [Fusarium napiforme]
MASHNGEPFFLPAERAQSLANYPHARIIPQSAKTIFVSGTSSRRGDNTVVGCTTEADGTHHLDISLQTEAVLQNIGAIIDGATNGACGLQNVVNATVFLTDMKDYAGMNKEWNKVWPDKTKAPARTCIQVAALPNERLNVEIQCTVLWAE